MKLRFFGCAKFGWLSSEACDRDLTLRERAFMARHKLVCSECARKEDQGHMALNMLRLAALEPEFAPSFDQRVIRRHKVETVRASLQYWFPAILGCGIAVVAMLAGLQMISESSQLPVLHAAGIQSHRIHTEGPLIPVLDQAHFRSARTE